MALALDISAALDNLVAPVLPPRDFIYTGYGRDLVPFFSEDAPSSFDESPLMQPLESRKGSPKAAQKQKRRQNEKASRGKPAPSSPSNKIRGYGASDTVSQSSYFAAPGFQSSPKPEALPLPTLSLIERAVGGRGGYYSTNFVARAVKVGAA